MGPCGLQVVGGLVSRPRSEPDAILRVRDVLKERTKTQVCGQSSQLGGEERGRGNRKQVDKGPGWPPSSGGQRVTFCKGG